MGDSSAVHELFTQIAPYYEQSQLVAAQIEIICGRIRFLLDGRQQRASERVPPRAWPPELRDAEGFVEACAAASATAGLDLPVSWLQTRLGLTRDERCILWVLIAHEMSEQARTLLRQLNTETTTDPTTDTLRLAAFGEHPTPEAFAVLAPNSPLAAGRLIERTDNDHAAPEHRHTWKAARRIVGLAFGDTNLDPELAGVAELVSPARLRLGLGGQGVEADGEIAAKLAAAIKVRRGEGGAVIVQAPRGTGRRTLLRSAAASLGLELLEVDIEGLARDAARARDQLVAVARDCRLFRCALLLRNVDALLRAPKSGDDAALAGADHVPLLRRELRGLLVLGTATTTIPPDLFAAPAIVEPKPLTGEQRVRLWSRALPGIGAPTVEQLATVYPVAPAVIHAAAIVAGAQLAIAGSAGALDAVRLGLRAVLDGRMAGVATRIETMQPWSALVLPAEQRRHLAEMVVRIRNQRIVHETWKVTEGQVRGLGVSALFYGPPGTGKTMAAGLIANELFANLYQVDTSKLVSKWLGETEKNLSRLFDAAEEAHGILLFDEADALFGKRTAVASSNDRYANQETNYLLTRLEAFRGICILTTNHESAIDEAFKRRIAFHVDFPMPDAKERGDLWRTMMRPTIPTQGTLDFAGLARRYEMSGGYIRKAVLRAAFFAADACTPVTNDHLERAAQLEYQAMGRILPSSL